jgi:hypothetical protein
MIVHTVLCHAYIFQQVRTNFLTIHAYMRNYIFAYLNFSVFIYFMGICEECVQKWPNWIRLAHNMVPYDGGYNYNNSGYYP